MPDYSNFTSLPPQEEAQFVVFEERSQNNAKSARTIALAVAGPLFLLIIINYFTNQSEKKELIQNDPSAGIMVPKVKATPAPQPSVPAAPVGAAPAPAPAPAPGAAPAPAAAPAAAPAPTPGATPVTPGMKPPTGKAVSPKDLGKKPK